MRYKHAFSFLANNYMSGLKNQDVCQMNILLLGSGARENALAKSLSESKHCSKLFIAPGNPGTAAFGTNVPLSLTDFEQISTFCLSQGVELLVAGPEEPLVKGIRDFLENIPGLEKMAIIGPGSAGAMLEGSKAFSKAFMQRHGIPSARYQSFQQHQAKEAIAFLKQLNAPYVIKASGLAAGKGVVIANTFEEAVSELEQMFGGKFGTAGQEVVIEEFLKGIECSVFVLTDGHDYVILPEAKDYKRIGEGDTGLNTGGMGAVSPVPFYDEKLAQLVKERMVEPTIRGLQREGILYSGFIFLGLMVVNHEPYLIEYNCRMGDPETEVVIPRLKNDLVDLLYAAGTGKLKNHTIETDDLTALTVVCVSGGYPEIFQKGFVIAGLDQVAGVEIYHAGTKSEENKVLTSGGRVLACTVLAEDIRQARAKVYKAIEGIQYQGMYFRRDIGKDLMPE